MAEIQELRAMVARLEANLQTLAAAVTNLSQDSGGGEEDFSQDDSWQDVVPEFGGGDPQGAFRFEGDKITNCNFYAAHAHHHIDDVTVGEGQADGTWWLNVPHGNLSGATVSKSQGQNNDDNTSIPLFTIENGVVTQDYRGMPFVPIYA